MSYCAFNGGKAYAFSEFSRVKSVELIVLLFISPKPIQILLSSAQVCVLNVYALGRMALILVFLVLVSFHKL